VCEATKLVNQNGTINLISGYSFWPSFWLFLLAFLMAASALGLQGLRVGAIRHTMAIRPIMAYKDI
jgi:hypothetical protein